MQTRIEKWKNYREEIKKESFLSNNVSKDLEKVKKYKEQIKKIDSKILSIKNLDVSFAEIFSEKQLDDRDIQELQTFMKTIDGKDKNEIVSKIKDWYEKFDFENILNSNKEDFDSKWLLKDEEYKKFSNLQRRISTLNELWVHKQVTTRKSINDINDLAQKEEIFSQKVFNDVVPESSNKKIKNSHTKKFFFFFLFLTLGLAAAFIALIILFL